MSNKIYLGDAVYAEIDEWNSVVLTTEDGIRATNRIVLELEVAVALVRWLKRVAPGVAKAADG